MEAPYLLTDTNRKGWGVRCSCGWRSPLFDAREEAMTSATDHLEIDAHLDLRDTYEGLSLSHATVLRRVAEDFFVVGQRHHRVASEREQRRPSLQQNVAGLIAGKLDVDANGSTAARFNVRGIPTFLVIKDGQVKEQIVGAVDKGVITKALDKVL